MSAGEVLLCAEDVGYRVGERALLAGVSLELRAGQVVGLVGPNGAGKSTLLRVLGGLWRGAEGRVTLLGEPLKRLSARQVARVVAHVPQLADLGVPFTVRQIVMMGRTPHLGRFALESARDRQAAERAMQRTQTLDLAERLIGTLSGGERQRALIARALTQEPRVLLADEPTANLDVGHQLAVLELVRALAREDGLGVLLALHDLELAARFCDRLVLLSGGRVHAEGAAADVLTAEHLRAVYGVRAVPYTDPVTGHLRLAVAGRA